MFRYNEPTKIRIVPKRQDSRGNCSGCKHNILNVPMLFVLCDAANWRTNVQENSAIAAIKWSYRMSLAKSHFILNVIVE